MTVPYSVGFWEQLVSCNQHHGPSLLFIARQTKTQIPFRWIAYSKSLISATRRTRFEQTRYEANQLWAATVGDND